MSENKEIKEENKKPVLGRNPFFSNGRTTRLSYLIVAVKSTARGYNAVGIRKVGCDEYKFHFWPNAEVFGVELPHTSYSRDNGGLSHHAYVGCILDKNATKAMLDALKVCRGVTVAHRDHVMEVLDSNVQFDPTQHVTASMGDAEDAD